MKLAPRRNARTRRGGYAIIAVVASLSLVLISMLTHALRGNLNSLESQGQAQMKQDFHQKEDAVLNALLHIVPNRAVGAMQRHSASSPGQYTWERIFEDAVALANAEQAVDPDLLASLSLGSAVLANTGDMAMGSSYEVFAAPVRTYAGGENLVNGGNWWEFYMLGEPTIGPFVPAPLALSNDHYLLDKTYPIITSEKTYTSGYPKGLHASPTSYPRFNLLQYPDVRFGYRRPGELFVAKRNWWVFSMTFGQRLEELTGIPAVTKNYVLSIYEIPSQLPLASSTLMRIGRFEDGTDWTNISLDGGVFAGRLETEGEVALSAGSISARESVLLGGATTVEGRAVTQNFDALGEREKMLLGSDSDFYDASVGGNVGKVAFIPINRGLDFLQLSSDGPRSERISPTGWNDYTRGANQARMRVEIRDMAAIDNQTPVSIRFRYFNTSNQFTSVDYTRGDNWPADHEPGGEDFPFQTTELENGRRALVFHVDRLPGFLDSLGNAAALSANRSLYIYPNASRPTVTEPNVPSTPDDLAVTMRGGQDLSPFTAGLSLVTNLRLYIGDALNNVTVPVPAQSGYPAGEDFYPPLSLFAPEQRFGESLNMTNPVSIRGQIGSLKTARNETVNPLEITAANESRVDSGLLSAELHSLRSPAELPPIHMMNWMVTIEEIH